MAQIAADAGAPTVIIKASMPAGAMRERHNESLGGGTNCISVFFERLRFGQCKRRAVFHLTSKQTVRVLLSPPPRHGGGGGGGGGGEMFCRASFSIFYVLG